MKCLSLTFHYSKPIGHLYGQDSPIFCIKIDSHNNRIYCISNDNTVKVRIVVDRWCSWHGESVVYSCACNAGLGSCGAELPVHYHCSCSQDLLSYWRCAFLVIAQNQASCFICLSSLPLSDLSLVSVWSLCLCLSVSLYLSLSLSLSLSVTLSLSFSVHWLPSLLCWTVSLAIFLNTTRQFLVLGTEQLSVLHLVGHGNLPQSNFTFSHRLPVTAIAYSKSFELVITACEGSVRANEYDPAIFYKRMYGCTSCFSHKGCQGLGHNYRGDGVWVRLSPRQLKDCRH